MRTLPLALVCSLALASGAFAKDSAKDVSDKEFMKLKPEQLAFVVTTPKKYVPKHPNFKRVFTKKELAGGTSQWLVIRLAPGQYAGKRTLSDFKRGLPTSVLGKRPQLLAVQKALKLKRFARLSFYLVQKEVYVLPKMQGRYAIRRLSTFRKRIKKGIYLEQKPKVAKKKS